MLDPLTLFVNRSAHFFMPPRQRPARQTSPGPHSGPRRAFMTQRSQDDNSFASTLANGLAVLEAFDLTTRLLGNSELAARTGLSRPTTARLTQTLARLGYLRYHPARFKYSLWTGALRAAYPLLAQMDIRQRARSGMQALSEHLKAAISLVVLDDEDAVILETSRSIEIDAHTPEIGLSAPLIQVAAGRALLALLPENEREQRLAQLAGQDSLLWQRHGPATRLGIDACLTRGFCVSTGDWRSHVHSAGVPLYRDGEGRSFALSCGIAAFRLQPGQLETEIGPRLVELARSIQATVASAA